MPGKRGSERKREENLPVQVQREVCYRHDSPHLSHIHSASLYLRKKNTAQRGSLLHKISFDAETGVSDFLNIILVI